jgi:tRNA threonylcarbamoyl adenosine modification protein YeaZ/ribosomal-protein-alanine acetyltransferase
VITLALDTSTDRTSLAIFDEKKELFSGFHDGATEHGHFLPYLLREALKLTSEIDQDINQVIIGMGPGPFTGLRSGISFGQAFAFARNIPWIGICSLDAIARPDGECIVTVDARRKEVFYAHYIDGVRRGEPHVASPRSLPTGITIIKDLAPDLSRFPEIAQHGDHYRTPIYVRRPDAFPAPANVKFRAMTPLDLINVHRIEKDSYRDDPWTMAQFKEEMGAKNRFYIVAELGKENGQEIVGYAGATVRGESCDILTLTVEERYRRLGIGRELLRRMIDWARTKQVEKVMLEVRTGNNEALPLYLDFGFVEIATRRSYYGPGKDAIIMEKVL